MQLSSEGLYTRTLAREQVVQNAFCLFAESLLRQLLSQFSL